MFEEGDIKGVEKLLLPAKRVLKAGPQIKYEVFERRVELWNQIRTNSDRYQDGECGTFLQDLDSHFCSQFDAALVALAVSMKANGESFSGARIFSDEELKLYERIERYNVFEILTENDVKKRLMQRDEKVLELLHDYYIEMDTWVDTSLGNPEIRLTLRRYLKKRWDGYKGTINRAVASAVTELDWLKGLIGTWEGEAQRNRSDLKDEVAAEVRAENEALSSRLREREVAVAGMETTLKNKEQEVARREEAALSAAAEARKKEEQVRGDREALRATEDALQSREQRIEAAMKALNGDHEEGSRYVDSGEAKQYELTFIGRMETKIGDCPMIGGRAFRVDEVREKRDVDTAAFADSEWKALPENRSFTARLVEKKLLGRKKRYIFQARYAARVERYAGQGYDSDPLTPTDVTVVLAETRDRARSSEAPTVLCLASPTGFERRVRDFIDSDDFHHNFISRYLSVLILDLETGDLAFNPADETAQVFSGICELEIDSEKKERVRRTVKEAMLNALKHHDYVVYDDIQKACTDEPLVKPAFYECAAGMGGEVQFVEGVGLVMMRG
jgi:hypothetical protein